jgi:hypothetical protein
MSSSTPEKTVKGHDAVLHITDDGLLYAVDLVITTTGKDIKQANECLRDLDQSLFPRNKFVVRGQRLLVTPDHAVDLINALKQNTSRKK